MLCGTLSLFCAANFSPDGAQIIGHDLWLRVAREFFLSLEKNTRVGLGGHVRAHTIYKQDSSNFHYNCLLAFSHI
jgi:hypothetical protein